MWNKIRPLLVILSVAVNVAFIGSWLVVAAGHTPALKSEPPFRETVLQDCPLHRQLGITDEQWGKLEPALRGFRTTSRDLAREIHHQRRDLLHLLAAPQPARKAIETTQQAILAGQGKMQQLVIGQILAEREILTAAQQERLFSLIHAGMQFTDSCQMMGLGTGQVLRKDAAK